MNKDTAMDLALDALESAIDQLAKPYSTQAQYAITALRTAIKQARSAPEEPVYHLRQFGDVTKEQLDRYMATGDINPQPAPVQEQAAFNAGVPLLYPEMKDGETISVEYTTPPATQRQWVNLTDEEINACDPQEECWGLHEAVRRAEAILRSKNNG